METSGPEHRGRARSAYHHQVRAIAPETLVGRETELADLASFCTDPGSGDYLWLRAGPWAGKTALTSWFVLNPPPSVRVVSFFVTARFAANSDRGAFLDVVIEQLAAMLGQPVPASLTDATGTAHLLGLLDEAAAFCADRGQRLVLVVDGLDEDTGAGGHSIAALLPAKPAAGMRVIVTGRHDPPVPSDVPATHPLRDGSVARVLAASPHAQDVRHAAERELTRLLHGTDLEQDLLGLVTAAGGGLSSRDLAELTKRPPWEVEEAMNAVAGRTFARRPAARAEVYVLGHDELRTAAVRFLGDRLSEYRQRLHGWADGYARDLWPAHTPEYLLHGYFRMLHAVGDLPRMTACALDPARHDRMLAVSSGDTNALAEIAAAQDALLDRDTDDLRTMALLAVRHDTVVERNRHIPPGLPAVWALLGQPVRALALARSIADPGTRVEAMIALSEQQIPADDIIGEAEAIARGIRLSPERLNALVSVAKAAARAGRLEHGVALANEVPDPRRQALTLVGVVEAAARAGDTRGAAEVAAAIADRRGRFSAQRAVARAAAAAGDVEFGVALARAVDDPKRQGDVLREVAEAAARGGHVDEADRVARDIPDAKQRMWTLAAIAKTLAQNGNPAVAAALASDAAAVAAEAAESRVVVYATTANLWRGDLDAAAEVARRIFFPAERADALVEVAAAMALAGDLDRARTVVADAEAAARAVDRTGQQARTLVRVVHAAALVGDTEHARRLAGDAWALARTPDCGEWDQLVVSAELVADGRWPDLLPSIADPGERDRVSAEAVEVATAAGHLDRAATLAGGVTDPELRARTITVVARAVARAGDLDRATELANAAETTARTLTLSRRWALALADAADAVVLAGDPDRAADLASTAETFARATVDPRWRAQTLARAAEALAHAGSHERAAALVLEAEALTEVFEDPQDRQWVLATVAKALAHNGKTERAMQVAHAITNRLNRAPVLYAIIAAVARAGELGHARGLVLAITEPYDQLRAATEAARAAARAGHVEHATVLARDAESLAGACEVDSWRATTLTAAATAAAQAGDADYAKALVREAAAAARNLSDDRQEDRARSVAKVAQAAARAGDRDHATKLAREAETELRTSTDSAGRSLALQETVTATMLAGDTVHAHVLARGLPPHLRGRAWARAAQYSCTADARPLLARALRLTNWRESVDALAVVQPAVLTQIAQLLLADSTGG